MPSILIIDDTLELLRLLEQLFQMKNIVTATCVNEKSIWPVIQNKKPDLILLDVRLANADGRKICSMLRTKKRFKKVPVILMSCSPQLLTEYTNYGASGILEKPFSIKEIDSLISTYMHVRL